MLICRCHILVTSWFAGKVMYYAILQGSTEFILKHGEERMKMELANMYVL